MAYSIDFRRCVLENIANGMTWSEASKVFKISTGTICKWLLLKKRTDSLSDAKRKDSSVRKIDSHALLAAISERPDATLSELSEQFGCWPQSIHKRLVKLGITRKKKQRYTPNETKKSGKNSPPKSQNFRQTI